MGNSVLNEVEKEILVPVKFCLSSLAFWLGAVRPVELGLLSGELSEGFISVDGVGDKNSVVFASAFLFSSEEDKTFNCACSTDAFSGFIGASLSGVSWFSVEVNPADGWTATASSETFFD